MAGFTSRLERSANNEIPIAVQRSVIQAVVQESAALRSFPTHIMPSHTETYPVMDSFPEAEWLNGSTRLEEDFGLKQTTTMTWAGVNLVAAEMAIMVPLSDSHVQDQLFDVLGQIQPRIAERMGRKLDLACFWGDGKPTLWSGGAGVGIYDLAVGAGNVVTPATVIENDATPDLGQQFGYAAQLLEEDGFDATGFVVRRGLRWRLRNLRDANGQAVYQGVSQGFDGRPSETLFGESMYAVANGAWDNSRAVGFVADWQYGMIGVRQGMQFSIHRDGVISDSTGKVTYNAVAQDGFILRCSWRVGFATANPLTAMNSNNATRSPFAVVVPAGAPSS